eukprot:TRINITY_DN67289_c6_g1_i1.p1 TRINITY_DN67289_c6_g1~~TRINITY_DN67289_c6_g1_i1.p1  ORF type:complete len:147 (-),score=16.65 TRINITY_DN67289_c6_g1_i1:726-1166(-)
MATTLPVPSPELISDFFCGINLTDVGAVHWFQQDGPEGEPSPLWDTPEELLAAAKYDIHFKTTFGVAWMVFTGSAVFALVFLTFMIVMYCLRKQAGFSFAAERDFNAGSMLNTLDEQFKHIDFANQFRTGQSMADEYEDENYAHNE